MESGKIRCFESFPRIAVVIPSYRTAGQILGVIESIPGIVNKIWVVDDACPERSGKLVEDTSRDDRIEVIYHAKNQGVGGATISGFLEALKQQADIVIKLDGDGQMDPGLIPYLVEPILNGEADYVKGNRFYNLEKIRNMPLLRLFGNGVLSFMSKFSTGYWDLFDPNNGYVAIHANVLAELPLDKVCRGYFFESDMLFRLNTLRAVVVDLPMDACYGKEKSNLKISRVLGEFLVKHARNFIKRIFYNYYLRDLSLASIELPVGVSLFIFGVSYGSVKWVHYALMNETTPAGTVMMAALPIMLGLQLVLAFLGYDIASVPKEPIHKRRHGKMKKDSEYEQGIQGQR